MKKAIFTFMAMFSLTLFHVQAQDEPGTAPEGYTGGANRVNGLTQLYSVSGNYYLSADAAGGNPLSSFNIDVNKPSAGATVHQAFLFGTPAWNFIPQVPDNCVTLAGINIVWDGTASNAAGSLNSYDDVTAIVAPILNPAGAGITSLPVTECQTANIDGVALLVIFSDPSVSSRTIIIMFGGLSTVGDNFAITLAQPIDPNEAGSILNMGLGIEFGFQGSSQYSIVDVNGTRLTTAAGGADDAVDSPTNGNLITLGGLGDSNANPADPFAFPVIHSSDDELYSLLPLITNNTVNILVNTLNPSNDDNVFLSYFEISGAAIIGEGILLSQDVDTNCIQTQHTVTAHVQDDLGDPIVGTMVDFTVISGPNAGANFSVLTDANGHAFFTYAGIGGPGVDQIEACFTNVAGAPVCSNILLKVWIPCENIPVSDWAIALGIFLILAAAVLRIRKF